MVTTFIQFIPGIAGFVLLTPVGYSGNGFRSNNSESIERKEVKQGGVKFHFTPLPLIFRRILLCTNDLRKTAKKSFIIMTFSKGVWTLGRNHSRTPSLTAKYAKYAKKKGSGEVDFVYCPICLLRSHPMSTELIFKEESYKIVGACFEVYREKGCGFLEPVYQECLELEFRLNGVPYTAQRSLALEYKGTPLRSTYQPDFVCYDKIILELKAVKELTDEHRAQVQNYLRATGFQLGLLVNFGHHPKIQIERIANTRSRFGSGKKA